MRRAHVGIAAQTVPLPRRTALANGAGAQAVRVGSIERNMPAARAGLQVGDLIIAVDGQRIVAADDLIRLLDTTPLGRAIEITVLRNGSREQVLVVPVERP